MNPLLRTDSYKLSHWSQYPRGTTALHSYIEARKAPLWASQESTVFFGMQAILQKLKPFDIHDVEEAEQFAAMHGLPFNSAGWRNMLSKYNGNYPMIVKAAPEGLVIPTRNALVTVESTDPEFPWVGSYFEPFFLRVWYPTTVATMSYEAKRALLVHYERTVDDHGLHDKLKFALHDMGARGVSSGESAELGGMAHLVNFAGSDTIEGIVAARRFYNTKEMPAFSIPAAEHSTITSWGRDREADAYENMLNVYGGDGKILAVVSDSYDIINATKNIWGADLREKVIASGATLVIRPDSGDPEHLLPELLGILADRFGVKTNTKGYKVLQHVRLIWSDGIDSPRKISAIMFAVTGAGFSAENVALGMGGGLLQKINRDTFSFAMKCSAAEINGSWVDVVKTPINMPEKRSRGGRQILMTERGKTFTTIKSGDSYPWSNDSFPALRTVYRNGAIDRSLTLDQVRQNTKLWS
ncbi:nicotinate phosphoribosyltransferase [Methyloversatilis sp.]|uniref:nicotinate phosphoribosyltransferase n=1 Tax=Methyloversatilis sp. TaxID=2569862 RepID=UPI0035B15156